jgi:hypothetical protein
MTLPKAIKSSSIEMNLDRIMDIVTKLNKSRKQGREIRVIDTDGDIKTGVDAIERMRTFEAAKVKEFYRQSKRGAKHTATNYLYIYRLESHIQIQ